MMIIIYITNEPSEVVLEVFYTSKTVGSAIINAGQPRRML